MVLVLLVDYAVFEMGVILYRRGEIRRGAIVFYGCCLLAWTAYYLGARLMATP